MPGKSRYEPDANGYLFIACREGLAEEAYPDGPHYAIGFGHNGPDVQPGQTITAREAFLLLIEDVSSRVKMINTWLTTDVTVNQGNAILSLLYQGGTKKGKTLCELVNEGRIEDASAQFLEYGHRADGKFLAGLMKRRKLERRIFDDGNYGDLSWCPYWRGNPHDRNVPQEKYYFKPGDVPGITGDDNDGSAAVS
jgi:lysozyme